MAPADESKVQATQLSPFRVASLGTGLILVGMIGFYFVPGLIEEDAGGSKIVNSFYCSVMTLTTVGFGDICPGRSGFIGRLFLTVFPMLGLGFFCGPLLTMASSSWESRVPGGTLILGVLTLTMGVSMLAVLEGLTISDAVHLCVVTGTTIGYGDITPSSDLGRVMLALYAIVVCNLMGKFLAVAQGFLVSFCEVTKPSTEESKKKK